MRLFGFFAVDKDCNGFGQIMEGVAIVYHDVGVLSGFDAADAVIYTQGFGGVDGDSAQGGVLRQTLADAHGGKHGQHPQRRYIVVGGNGDFHACLKQAGAGGKGGALGFGLAGGAERRAHHRNGAGFRQKIGDLFGAGGVEQIVFQTVFLRHANGGEHIIGTVGVEVGRNFAAQQGQQRLQTVIPHVFAGLLFGGVAAGFFQCAAHDGSNRHAGHRFTAFGVAVVALGVFTQSELDGGGSLDNHVFDVAAAQLDGGNWIDFALRGNSQDAGDWFHYQNGLVLRLYADPTWGTYFKVGYGGMDGWFDADFGESALKYTGVDFSQEHTISYTIQDVYENDVFQGVRVDVKLDDAVVNFNTGSYVMIPASVVESAADHFIGSYLFAWANGKSITVTEAYLEQLDAEEEPEVPVVSKWNVSLGDSVGVNFELNLNEGDTVSAFIGENEIDSVYAEGMLCVKLAAAQMTDMITIKVNGEALDKTYSVRDYADYILDDANGYHASAKELVKAMLNYGAASQTYFAYNTENLANADIEAAAVAVPSVGGEMNFSGKTDGIVFYGASLVHKDKIAVRFYFTGNVDGADFGGYAVSEKNGMYYIEVGNINPQDMDQDITVTVNGTLTITYSPLDYIIRMYSKGGNSAALVQALYGYYLAAENYIPA